MAGSFWNLTTLVGTLSQSSTNGLSMMGSLSCEGFGPFVGVSAQESNIRAPSLTMILARPIQPWTIRGEHRRFGTRIRSQTILTPVWNVVVKGQGMS